MRSGCDTDIYRWSGIRSVLQTQLHNVTILKVSWDDQRLPLDQQQCNYTKKDVTLSPVDQSG